MLSVSRDAKTIKGQKRGYLTGILYLAPHMLSGRNLCPDASPGCITTCLNAAGRGVFNKVQRARIAKTQRFTSDRIGFMTALADDIEGLERKAHKLKMTPLVRLNGTSDLPWENMGVMSCRAIQFYDYTKSYRRMLKFLLGEMPPNYHLTFSRSECNESDALDILSRGGNVAVVFSTKKGELLPRTWKGFSVIDGDVDDARPTDNFYAANGSASIRCQGFVVGLRAKGKARRDTTGFVVCV